MYSRAQRGVALVYGVLCHALFAAAVLLMAFSLFRGLRTGLGTLHGVAAILANLALLLSFPVTHSWLLAPSGRRFAARLAPLGLGKDLSTTIFAAISSLQLIVVFLLWSPSGVTCWRLNGAARGAMGGVAAAGWILLFKSMYDAQLGLQTGWLGWSSIFRNRKPEYKPFATLGIYRLVRQPIYISFAIVLWAVGDGTPDQLLFAAGWTFYCVAGSALKERRYLQYFGDAFRRYQRQVPFWIPWMRSRVASGSSAPVDADVLVVGGGPVGLLLAALLAKRGLSSIIAERRTGPVTGSMAIGITPPSLAILDHLGIGESFTRDGVAIDRAVVYEAGVELGDVDFSRIHADHRFILSLPQSQTIDLLERHVRGLPEVRLLNGAEFVDYVEEAGGVTVSLREADRGETRQIGARYVVGCDGHRSQVRQCMETRLRTKTYGCRFLMADFPDHTAWGSDAYLFFGPVGSVEAFPLPGGRRRWIIMDDAEPATPGAIAAQVMRRVREWTGIELAGNAFFFASAFEPRRGLASHYFRGHAVLCGDAAHIMSPIGGQGMNTGFADAAHLADALSVAVAQPATARRRLTGYQRLRRRAFRVAAARAARGMWLGTRQGRVASRLRRWFLYRVLFQSRMREAVAPYFAMLTLPGARDLPRVLGSAPR